MSPEERREVLEQLLERVRRNAGERGRAAATPDDNHGSHAFAGSGPPDGAAPPDLVARPVPSPAPSRPLVRFEFEDEQTSTGDPDQIEALVLAEAAAAEAAARGDSEEPLSGPSTIPPAAAPAAGDSSGPLELEDLDSLGPPPYPAPAPAYVPPPPAFVAPPPVYEPLPPPAYEPLPPPAYQPPPVYEPPPPPAYEPPPPAYEPPPPAYEPPPYVAEPPRYLSEPPPAGEAEGEIAIDDEAVIELDEADLRSVPPEPGPMEAAFDAASPVGDAYGEHGPETDHAGFVDRGSLADIEAAALPPGETAAEPAPVPDAIPESQRQKRELDRPIDDALDGVEEPPPESGEVESQRYPAKATPIVDEVSAERIAEADIDEAPTPPPLSRAAAPEPSASLSGLRADGLDLASPAMVERPSPPASDVASFTGARPSEVASFGDLLDLALSLGD